MDDALTLLFLDPTCYWGKVIDTLGDEELTEAIALSASSEKQQPLIQMAISTGS